MSNEDSGDGRPQFPVKKVPELSPYGKQLLKQVKGSPQMVSPGHSKHWGLERPDSVMHAIPESFSQLVYNLPEEMLSMTDGELEESYPLTRQDRRLRILFWEAFEEANKKSIKMDLERVAKNAGLPTWESYEQKLYQSPALLAWVMRLPAHYDLQIKEGLELGMNRLMEIMSLPLQEAVFDKYGKPIMSGGKPVVRTNTSIGLLVLQAFKLLDQRRHGGYTQKSVNVNMEAGRIPENATIDPAELDRKLRELEDAVNGKPADIEVKRE